MALDISSEYHITKGLCVVFNNERFTEGDMKPRVGTSEDVRAIKETFKQLSYKVKIYNNCKAEDILCKLKSFQKPKYKCYDGLFVFFLTHGYKEGIYGTDGVPIAIEEIQLHLRAATCPPFACRPKVLVFQCCLKLSEGGGHDHPTAIEEHFLLALACQPYHKSYRTQKGSYFIQSLIEVIRDNVETKDFVQMMPIVRSLVNIKSSGTQSPECNSRLLYALYLKRRKRRSELVCSSRQCSLVERVHSHEKLVNQRSSSLLAIEEVVAGSYVNICNLEYPLPVAPGTRSSSTSSEEQFSEAEANLSVHNSIRLSPPSTRYSPDLEIPQTINYEFGLCLIINNSSISPQLEIEDIREVFEFQNYLVLTFTDLSKESIFCLLKSIHLSSSTFLSIVVFYLSQGEHNVLYDSRNNIIKMNEIFHNLSLHLNNKFFYFQTTPSWTKIDVDTEERKQLEEANIPPNSLCIHVSSESSLVSRVAETIMQFAEVELHFAKHLFEFVLKYHNNGEWHRTQSNIQGDFILKCNNSHKEKMYVCGLSLAACIRSQIVLTRINKKLTQAYNDFVDISIENGAASMDCVSVDCFEDLEREVAGNISLFLYYLRGEVVKLEEGNIGQLCHQINQCEKCLSVNIFDIIRSDMRADYTDTTKNPFEQTKERIDSWNKNCLAIIREVELGCVPLIIQQKVRYSQATEETSN